MIYDYECKRGHVTEDHRSYEKREQPLLFCPECQQEYGQNIVAVYVLVRRSIQRGTERKHGEAKIIRDERQVFDSHGTRWRDKGTTGKPGGVGRKTFFT